VHRSKREERRYGKGTIHITDKNVYINFKKFLGKPQSFSFPRSDVEDVVLLVGAFI